MTATPEQRLTIIKHLAGGKPLDVVATITHLDRSVVLDIASKHGYPDRDKLSWAVDVLAKKLDEAAALPDRTEQELAQQAAKKAAERPTVEPISIPAEPLTKPDEIRILLNTAKAHPSKRIQNAADRVFTTLDRLRDLIREDEEKHSERRRQEAEKEKLRTEIARLEEQLKTKKQALRKSPAQIPGGRAAAESGQLAAARANSGLVSNDDLAEYGLDSKTLRAWGLAQAEVDCPAVGRVPRRVLDAWLTAHPESVAS